MSTRWFTDDAVKGPLRIRPTFTAKEQETLAAILEFARSPANSRRELLHCLDAAGTLVHDTSSGLGSAPLEQSMKSAILAGGGVRLWHNHPSQDSLSHHDWLCAGTSADLEVLALNQRGSIFVGRIARWDDALAEILNWLPRLAPDLELHMSHLAGERGLDVNDRCELSKFTGHVLNMALAECCSVQYAYCLVPQDQEVVDRCSLLDIIGDGRAFAADALRVQLAQVVA